MSGFVNYKKRSITLPAGCKDLVDVLARPLRRRKDASPLADPKPLAFAGGTLGGWRVLVYPLPTGVSRATSLMMELLVSVCGLAREAGLDFRYFSWPPGSKPDVRVRTR